MEANMPQTNMHQNIAKFLITQVFLVIIVWKCRLFDYSTYI